MFKPTAAQAKAKATFHNRTKNNALLGPLASLSLPKIEQLSDVSNMQAWMDEPGFREWFLNEAHNRELLESSVELAIREAITILNMPCDGEKGSPKPSDKLVAMKIILEYAGYAPKKAKDENQMDKDIANMDEASLDELISITLKDKKKLVGV